VMWNTENTRNSNKLLNMKSVVGSMKIEFLFYDIISITKFIQCEKRHMNKAKATYFMDIIDC